MIFAHNDSIFIG